MLTLEQRKVYFRVKTLRKCFTNFNQFFHRAVTVMFFSKWFSVM